MDTKWHPTPRAGAGPLYLRLADGIAHDIEAGRLPDGWRLPTVRAVAHRLGTTPGTVARAYAELGHRGLTSGEAGRGTFVRPTRGATSFEAPPDSAGKVVDLAGNYAAPPSSTLLRELAGAWDQGSLATLVATGGGEDPGVLGADYLDTFGLRVSTHQVLGTSGGQHALFVALAALTRPGDRIAVDELANPGVRAAARLLRLRLVPVPHDGDGLHPDALPKQGVSVVVTTPTLHNPTGATMSADRRAELADALREHRLILLEDDPFAPLAADAPPPVSSFAPERCVYLASTSKAVAPGLRLAFLSCPPALHDAMLAAARSSAWMPPSLVVDLVRRLVVDGLVTRLADSRRAESVARLALVEQLLPTARRCGVGGAHAWVELADEWRGADLAALGRVHGVSVAPAGEFGGKRPGFRIGFGAPLSRHELARGLTAVDHMLATGPVVPR
ncbi:PLP-dependent aminotransferase family protein [Actinoplanes sp. NPDC051346]|uniref:aminotransferase-like domain-containing protein n=1 Tax=Actinoplanes sp. NPDC051346 TaxID=3155048 RepID=UPI003430FB50